MATRAVEEVFGAGFVVPPVQEAPQAKSCWLGRTITYVCTKTYELFWNLINWAQSFFQTKKSESFSPAHPLRMQQRIAVRDVQAPQFDPAIVKLQAFMNNVATLMGNSVYNNLILPIIQTVTKDLQNLPSQLPSLQALTLAIATAIANDLMQIIDNASSDATSWAKTALSWLIYGGDSASKDVKGQLKQQLSQQYSAQLASQPEGVLDRFLDWLTDKTHLSNANPLPSLDSIASNAKQFLLNLLISSLQTLLYNKIQELVQQLTAIVQNDITPVVQQTVTANCTLVGQIVSQRFCTLLQGTAPLAPPAGLPTIYQQSYDQDLQVMLAQIQAIINAYKQKGSASIETGFAQSEACDPNVRLMINPPAGQTVAGIEQTLTLQTAKTLVSLVLPDQSTNVGGLVVTTRGVITLLKQLQLPPQITQSIQNMLQLPQSLFPNGLPPTLQQISSAIGYFCESAVGAIATDQINNGLSLGLNIGMNYVVSPAYLNMWMVRGALPASIQSLVQGIFCLLMADANDDIAELFMPLSNTQYKREAVFASIMPMLYDLVQSSCNDVNLASAGVTQDVLLQVLTPFLNQLGDYLLQNKATTLPAIKQALLAFTQPQDTTSNSTYGSMIKALAVDIGGLKLLGNDTITEELCEVILKSLISKGMTSSFYPLWVNEQNLVTGVVSGLQQVMGTQAQVDNLLFGTPIQVVDVSVQLNTQLGQIAGLIRSLVTLLIDQIPSHSNWFSSTFTHFGSDALKKLLPSNGDLNTAVTKVFNTMLSDRLINENLYLKMVANALTGLQDSANALST